MSAGGLSYSGLRTSAKATLPSVEMWGTNMNILRDPPKSIHTRRIDKVGQTQSVLNAQDQSGDRIAEAINVYARGVNPMVAVSFDNYSNNAGRSSPFQNSNKNVSLPYKVTTFRPPIMRQEDLLPLSRLPRNWFYSYTNPSFPDVVQAAQCNETGKSVHNTILHPQATSSKTVNAVGNVPRDAPSNTVLSDISHMSTDAKLHVPYQTYLSDDYDTGSEKKSIHTDKRDVVAITNKTFGDMSTSHEFNALAPGTISDTMTIDVGSNRSFLASNDHTNFITKDPKQIHWNKRIYEAFTQKSMNKSTNLVENMDTSKFIHVDKTPYTAMTNKSTNEKFINPHENTDISTIPTKEYLYQNVRTQSTSVFQLPQHPTNDPTSSLNENPLRMSVRSTKNLKGGSQPTENAVSTIQTKPYLYNDVRTQKTFLTMDNQENQGVMSHSVQESLLPSAETSKSFIPSKNALDGGVYEIHNEKRTPIHSMQTNTQTPYSMPLLPETIMEQRRTHPIMETSTTKIDPVQIEATRDVYQIQSRNGSKKIHPMLSKGGFEGQGNAVPVFNQYENYNYSIPDQMRQDLRQKTVSIMEGRYEHPTPVFS